MEAEEFLLRMASGETERKRVMTELYPVILRQARTVCRRQGLYRQEDAEDITQEACITLLTKWQTFRGESALSTWLWSVISNRVNSYHRAAGRLVSRDDVDDSAEAARPVPPSERTDFSLEHSLCVQQALAHLDNEPPPRTGSVRTIDLLLFTVEAGSDTAALAEYLGCSEAAAKERKRYALQKFKDLCERYCGTPECALQQAGT